MALNGDRLREAAEDYGCLGIALKHLIELMHIEPLVDRALEADPNDDELRGFKKDIACFQILAVIGSISFVPYLQRTAIAHRLDPSPFTICSEHLTAESLAKAIALAEHLALLADISVPAAAGGGDGDGDNGEYRPATYFNKGMADKLRQAASPKRKTKRVRTQVIDGVVCYYVPDARRWWPSGVPR
ncbi:MAG: hypothetical protein EA378_04095 [Phycisphaerales bacterium]|nr:MAG: hypothetical protein EA378_04095 [Phycisphaerales bacterium]